MVMRFRAVANTSSLVVGNNHLVGGISSFDGEMDIYIFHLLTAIKLVGKYHLVGGKFFDSDMDTFFIIC